LASTLPLDGSVAGQSFLSVSPTLAAAGSTGSADGKPGSAGSSLASSGDGGDALDVLVAGGSAGGVLQVPITGRTSPTSGGGKVGIRPGSRGGGVDVTSPSPSVTPVSGSGGGFAGVGAMIIGSAPATSDAVGGSGGAGGGGGISGGK
jgi:hypothetical protein